MSNMHLMLISSFVFVQIHQCASVGMASATRSHAAAAAHADDHRAAAAAHRAARSGVERKRGRDEGAAAAAAIDASDVPPMPAKRTRSAVASLSLQLEDFAIGEEEEKGMDEGEEKDEGHAPDELEFGWDVDSLVEHGEEEDEEQKDDGDSDGGGASDSKEERKTQRRSKKERKKRAKDEEEDQGDATPAHVHDMRWFEKCSGYKCYHCRKAKEKLWMCVVKVKPACMYAECKKCNAKREKDERADPDAAAARWSTKLKRVRMLMFSGHAFALPAHCATTPLGLFHRFVPVEMIDRMVEATNRYANRPERKSKVSTPHPPPICISHAMHSCTKIFDPHTPKSAKRSIKQRRSQGRSHADAVTIHHDCMPSFTYNNGALIPCVAQHASPLVCNLNTLACLTGGRGGVDDSTSGQLPRGQR